MSVRSSETQSSVEVSQACPEDTGSYTVIVRNSKGSAQHTVSLSVIGETHFGLQFSVKIFRVLQGFEKTVTHLLSLKCMHRYECLISTSCCRDVD